MSANVAGFLGGLDPRQSASPAIITHDRVLTYRQLDLATGIVARHLRQHGVLPGQVVGVSMAQNPLHLICLLAIARVGAVSLPLHLSVPAERRLLSARRFGAAHILSGRAEMALPGIPFVSLAGLPFDGRTILPDAEIHPASEDAPFRIAISSGTSGDPKGMIFSHGMMRVRNRKPEPGLRADSRVIPMDLNFIAGFGAAFRAFTAGASVVLPRDMGSEQLLTALVRHDATHVTLSPAQVHGIVERIAVEDVHCPGLVCLRIGGGPIATDLLRRAQRALSPNTYVVYGSTESGVLSCATPRDLARRPTSVGRLHRWARVEVVDERDCPLPRGASGVLRIRSEDQIDAYHRDDARNRAQFRDGWFYPGDRGRFDDEGFLYIEGRDDDQLNIGGLKVNPEDIDAVLAAHPAVVDAGAFVLVAADGRQSLAAALVLRAPEQMDALRAEARATLGPLAPAYYVLVDALPRTATGKLRRGELGARFRGVETGN